MGSALAAAFPVCRLTIDTASANANVPAATLTVKIAGWAFSVSVS